MFSFYWYNLQLLSFVVIFIYIVSINNLWKEAQRKIMFNYRATACPGAVLLVMGALTILVWFIHTHTIITNIRLSTGCPEKLRSYIFATVSSYFRITSWANARVNLHSQVHFGSKQDLGLKCSAWEVFGF